MSESLTPTPTPVHINPQTYREDAASLWQNPLAPELRGSVEERNAWLDHALDDDPNRPLPAISLETALEAPFGSEAPNATTTNFNVLSPTGQNVGFVVLRQPTEPANYAGSDKHFLGRIKIFGEARKQGYGPAAYLAVLKSLPQGAGLRTEGVLSDDAIRAWDKMVSKGVARPSDKGGAPTAYETVF